MDWRRPTPPAGTLRESGTTAQIILSIIAAQNVKTIKDLSGTTIGVTDKVGPAYTLPVLALASVGLKADAARYAILGGRPALVTALASAKIQAAAFHVDDGLTVAKKDPNVHVMATK